MINRLTDIEICKNLIGILESQIIRAKEGTMFMLPGSTVEGSIKLWQREITKHKRTIAALEKESHVSD